MGRFLSARSDEPMQITIRCARPRCGIEQWAPLPNTEEYETWRKLRQDTVRFITDTEREEEKRVSHEAFKHLEEYIPPAPWVIVAFVTTLGSAPALGDQRKVDYCSPHCVKLDVERMAGRYT